MGNEKQIDTDYDSSMDEKSDDEPELVGDDSSHQNWKGIVIALLVIVIICGLIVVAIIIVMPRDTSQPIGEQFSFDDVFDIKYKPKYFTAKWVGQSNTFVYKTSQNELVAYNADTNSTTLLMNNSTFRHLNVDRFFISEDLKFVLLAFKKDRVYRHSYTARYSIYHIHVSSRRKKLVSFPAGPVWEGRRIQYAGWSPTGHALAFVYENNLYYQASPDSSPIQVTTNGQRGVIFNAIPDWVYEEEILSQNSALWWSPDHSHICYATFNDSRVPLYKYAHYGTGMYDTIQQIAYPKAGDESKFINPKVRLFVYSTSDSSGSRVKELLPPAEFRESDHYFTQVVWRDNQHVLIVWSNRAQNKSIITICDVRSAICHVNLVETSHEGKGWVEIPPIRFIDSGQQYLVVLPAEETHTGFWNHVTLVSSQIGKTGLRTMLTHGATEVTGIVGYSGKTEDVYYISTNGDARQRHLFRVSARQPSDGSRGGQCVTCDGPPGCRYVRAIFSADASHYMLDCLGPDVPSCVLRQTLDDTADILLEGNSELVDLLKKKALPRKEYFEIQAEDGHKIWAQIFLPPELNKKHIVQYPLLIETYAGPGSQSVTEKFRLGWSTYMSSSESVIYAVIDGRGSGARGQRHLHSVYRQLGTIEVDDQVTGARYLRDQFSFVDENRVAIWGSSYGGFVTSHALADTSNVISCGVAMAPVTDWRYYDTVYTERYMGMAHSHDNFRGYDNANVSRKAALFKKKHFMLVHGTGDDNVHFQHSAQLIKALTEADVMFSLQLYVDKSHSIAGPRTGRHLYQTLTRFLQQECWEGGEPREHKKA